MKKLLLLGLIIIISGIVIACSSVQIEEYKEKQPVLLVDQFFTGDLVAYGIVRDRSGKTIRTFKATLKGSWRDGVGTLSEIFWFDDGERQTRTWVMSPDGDGDYIGTAGDVEGRAFIQARGNAMRLVYQLRLPFRESEIVVSMDDWMYQVVPGVVINETIMTKWGFHVGKVTLVIMKGDIVNHIPDLIRQFDQ